jgi:hypothetical protein
VDGDDDDDDDDGDHVLFSQCVFSLNLSYASPFISLSL